MLTFHAGAGPVDKNEHISILDITSHLVGHNAAEGVKTAAHVAGLEYKYYLTEEVRLNMLPLR